MGLSEDFDLLTLNTESTFDVSINKDGVGKKHKSSKSDSRVVSGATTQSWGESEGGGRQIEVQQNWLARLFRVKPAMRHLCFSMPRRRARQEVAILLREWRQFGIKDVEVDKERNIIFARVGSNNGKLFLSGVRSSIRVMWRHWICANVYMSGFQCTTSRRSLLRLRS